jgi:hypothetical protein
VLASEKVKQKRNKNKSNTEEKTAKHLFFALAVVMNHNTIRSEVAMERDYNRKLSPLPGEAAVCMVFREFSLFCKQ